MLSWFGKPRSQTAPKESIVKLRETLLLLEKREAFLQTKVDQEVKVAKENATKNKRAALMALKKKKQYEAQIEKLSASRMTVETQVLAIESANVNLETIKAMSDGAKAMKSIHGELNVDKVDKTMEDINDQMALANEIGDAISQPTAFGTDLIDEDDLAAELQELEQESLDEQLLSKEATPSASSSQAQQQPEISAPSVPKGEPSRKTAMTEEEAELEELKASMAM